MNPKNVLALAAMMGSWLPGPGGDVEVLPRRRASSPFNRPRSSKPKRSKLERRIARRNGDRR